MFNIILKDEKLETIFGNLYKGDILETVNYEEISEVEQYVNEKYIPEGIKVNII